MREVRDDVGDCGMSLDHLLVMRSTLGSTTGGDDGGEQIEDFCPSSGLDCEK